MENIVQVKHLQATTKDKFLGGQFEVLQPSKGRHRSGLDAVLLAAAVPDDAKGNLFDLGAGVGVAGLATITRISSLSVTLVEYDQFLCELAQESLNLRATSHLAERVSVMNIDVTAKGSVRHHSGLKPNCAHHVIMNPPYYERGQVRPSPDEMRSQAHILGEGGLDPWVRTAADILRANGTLTIIFRPENLTDVIIAMKGRFGAVTIFPIFPRIGQAATRIIVQGTRNSRAPNEIRPGLTLHETTGDRFLPEAEAILRRGHGLALRRQSRQYVSTGH